MTSVGTLPRCPQYLDDARCTRSVHAGHHEVTEGELVTTWIADPPKPAHLCASEDDQGRECNRPRGHSGMHSFFNPDGTLFCSWSLTPREEDQVYTAGRDSAGNIRLSQGEGPLVALASESREQIQEWFDRPTFDRQGRRKYQAALDLLDREANS